MTDLIGFVDPSGETSRNWTAHSKQHGGWARQATRRGETFVGCSTCGQRPHPRPFAQAAQERRESASDFIRAFLVALLCIGAMASLTFVVAASR
jgi:hypothetical protein